jgi:hypothetical protein
MVLSWLVLALSLVQMAEGVGIHDVGGDSNRVFLYPFARHGEVHRTLVVTAGNTFSTSVIQRGGATCVSLKAAMPFDLGDGAGLTIVLKNESRRIEAARIYLDPAHVRADRAWKPLRFEIPADLDHFTLQFSVDTGPRGEPTADWIGLASGSERACLFGE